MGKKFHHALVKRPFVVSMVFLVVFFVSQTPLSADDCTQTYPNPVIKFDHQDTEGRVYIPVDNWSAYSSDMFRKAPELPPCGLNTQSSRTWVSIYNADTNARIYGFCALGSNEILKNIWFKSNANSGRVYIIMNDRACEKTYRSNTLTWGDLVTVVLLVRHAEKASTPPDDPPLTEAGEQRAQELIHVAEKAGVKAIYATNTRRSQQTAMPLSVHLDLPITIYNNINSLKNTILTEYTGEVVLVVGHSPTVPEIVNVFGGDPHSCLIDDEFDNLCILAVYMTGKTKVMNLQYGALSPYSGNFLLKTPRSDFVR